MLTTVCADPFSHLPREVTELMCGCDAQVYACGCQRQTHYDDCANSR